MKRELPEVRPADRTPLVEALLGIIRQLLDRVAQLEETTQQLRAAIAQLKGQKPRPDLKPSLREASKPATERPEGSKRPGSAKRPKTAELTMHHEVLLHVSDLPEGARLRCYAGFVVPELRIKNDNTRSRRARQDLPAGGAVLAPFPAGVLPVAGGHCGANRIAYILDQYPQAQVTAPLLLEQLWEYDSDSAAGQRHRILTAHKERFHQEKGAVRAAGLAASSYLGTDDTGARPQGPNGSGTAIGNAVFAYVASSAGTSRLNFWHVRHGGQRAQAINATTWASGARQQRAAALVTQLTPGPPAFVGEPAWPAWLTELASTNERHVRIATEGALLGGLVARGVAPDLVVLSDGAPQFVVRVHARCWIHAQRPLAKLVPHNDEHRAASAHVRQQLGELDKDLKAQRAQPEAAQRPVLAGRFDALVAQRSGYPSSDGVLPEMRDHRADWLRVLERPEVPLHNNALESDIREFVQRRKVRGGRRNDAGRRCRDTLARLKKTCRKLGLRFGEYLPDRVRGRGQVPRRADLIRQQAQGVATAPNQPAVPA